ncbi:MAG: hypothetical protein J1G38_00450 [Clostridiales bacterium]|nr:hypothetical protein [Clostridiales bacterium]
MKKRMLALALTAAIAAVPALAGCEEDGGKDKEVAFGVFEQNGYHLTAFATKEISGQQALQMVKTGSSTLTHAKPRLNYVKDAPPPLSAEDYNAFASAYAQFTVEISYFKDGSSKKKTETQIVANQSFHEYLQQNSVPASAGLVIKNFVLSADAVNYMVEQNSKFMADPRYIYAPFRSLYSFHLDKAGRLVVQMRDYTEIPASATGGGVDCNYRQDTEAVYDGENKLIKWHTSLGVMISTAGDTLKEGYIYEAKFTWGEKGN